MILVAFGSNLPGRFGPPEAMIRAAASEMETQGLRIARMSRIWASAPVPVSDQPWYKNAVAAVETHHAPRAVLKILKDIETNFGRADRERDAARVIDLDLISYGDKIVDEDDMVLPHPRMQVRAFVLSPLSEVAPGWRHPVSGLYVSEMIANLPQGQKALPVEVAV